MLSSHRLHWAAGFLDGEGCFLRSQNSLVVTASQKDEWHVRQLEDMFGGVVARYKGGDGTRLYWRWTAAGSLAAGVMMTLFGLLSPRRQARVAEHLAHWRANGRTRAQIAQSCKRGHLWTEENTRLYRGAHGLQRYCRACSRAHMAAHRAKRSTN